MADTAEPIMSRAEAQARGLKRYFSGKPCKNGNVAQRYTAGNGCLCPACAAERSQRTLAWQKDPANAERYKAHLAKRKFSEKIKASQERSRKKYAEKIIAKVREWQSANPERVAASRKRWNEKNPEILRALREQRNRAIRQATPSWWSKWDRFVISEAKELAKLRTQMTGVVWEVDHMIPIQAKEASGLHCAANVQVIPKALNQWKRGRLVLIERGEWIKYA